MAPCSAAWASAWRSDVVTPATEADHTYMRRALALAARGWGRVAPNPLVGCVLVRDGAVVGEGWHAEYGRAHAEVAALLAAGEHARGATAYVTLEPCSHHGKTPPCTDALREAGVAGVVSAASDPDPSAAGGAAVLARQGMVVIGGVEADAARDLNAPFFHRHSALAELRPWIELKLALTLDARIADAEGRSAWITGEEARAEVHRLRANHDAVAVAVGTVLADDPQLTVRGEVEPRVPPVRIVLDRDLLVPAASRLVASAKKAPVWVIATARAARNSREALEAHGVEVLEADTLPAALHAVRERGIGSMMVEGGGRLASTLLAGDHVDRLSLFYAPLILGQGALDPFSGIPGGPLEHARRWRHLGSTTFGADTLITLARPD